MEYALCNLMKVLLISDTHGWLDPTVLERFHDVKLILHAGDVGSQDVLDQLNTIAPTHAVRGNMDWGDVADALSMDTSVDANGTRIAIFHIGGTPKKPKPGALDVIKKHNADILLIGHSHIPLIERKNNVLWVNPGAAGRQGFHNERTCMLLTLAEERTIDLISLGKR